MASSKFPVVEVPVPKSVLALEADGAPVVCNLRLNQRDDPSGPERHMLELMFMHGPAQRWLRRLLRNTNVAILLQGYGELVATVVVSLDSVYWSDGYPRLDFCQKMELAGYKDSGIWAGLVLAIAQVPQDLACGAWADREAERFVSLVQEHAVDQTATFPFGEVEMNGCFVDAHDGPTMRRVDRSGVGQPLNPSSRLLAQVVETGEYNRGFPDLDSTMRIPVVLAEDPE